MGMNVGALVTLVAAVHYFYMREFWIQIHESPIVYRYIDWSITVPLQMIEFYLILSAINPNLGKGMLTRLFFGTVFMLATGYAGESYLLDPYLGFALGMTGWLVILWEIFGGEASKVANQEMSKYVKESYKTMRLIVSAGWSVYPLGYLFGYLLGGVDDASLNLVYNLADLLNKIGFCLAIWASGKNCTLEKKGEALLA